MTNNQLNRERLEKIKSWRETYGAGSNVMLPAEEAEELARIALAAMDSEPVFNLLVSQAGYKGQKQGNNFGFTTLDAARELKEGKYLLYRHAQQPVVPEEMNFSAACNFVQINGMAKEDRVTLAMRVWNACRAAMLQAQSDDDGEPTDDERIMAIEGIQNCERSGDEGWVVGEMGITRCACGQAGNSPVIPDGYVMVPMRLTAENGAKGVLSGEFSETQFVNCPECFGDDECETCDGSGRIEIKVPVSWTTIKEIWIKGVEHFAAAPQENN
ncbi:hypothetical protein [Klebsiella pneumoniae]|uniref:hypothetical protein n=1 Tax=Klebsiella pneumoniae TaxID=573 RepID=UPI000E2C2DA6|nr:hypothetical protein [Klebsiella pneumoniae]SYO03828.1 Uncharacterised protein [Klebsiella pneumoniae]